MKSETDIPSETFLGFAEEEKIYKEETLFAHLLRVSRNLSSHTKTAGFFHKEKRASGTGVFL